MRLREGGTGDNVTENTTTAFNFASGVLTSSLFGINLSSSTGYSTSTTLEIDFSQQGYACGSANYPERTDPGPAAVVADEHSTGNS